MAGYSTLYPDTNSDSPSVKSKGARLVSAKHDTKNIIPAGNKGNINQVVWICVLIMEVRFKEPTINIVLIIINPIETS